MNKELVRSFIIDENTCRCRGFGKLNYCKHKEQVHERSLWELFRVQKTNKGVYDDLKSQLKSLHRENAILKKEEKNQQRLFSKLETSEISYYNCQEWQSLVNISDRRRCLIIMIRDLTNWMHIIQNKNVDLSYLVSPYLTEPYRSQVVRCWINYYNSLYPII